MGMIKRQAAEFRAQFDEAIKDSEFEQVKKDFEELKSDAQATVREATQDIDDEMRELDDVRRGVDRDLSNALRDDAKAADNDDADDWIDEHNQTILDGEQRTEANGAISAGEDDGGQVETEGTDRSRHGAATGLAAYRAGLLSAHCARPGRTDRVAVD